MARFRDIRAEQQEVQPTQEPAPSGPEPTVPTCSKHDEPVCDACLAEPPEPALLADGPSPNDPPLEPEEEFIRVTRGDRPFASLHALEVLTVRGGVVVSRHKVDPPNTLPVIMGRAEEMLVDMRRKAP